VKVNKWITLSRIEYQSLIRICAWHISCEPFPHRRWLVADVETLSLVRSGLRCMKDLEPSAIHSVPPREEEERTGAFRHPLHQYALDQGFSTPSETRLRSTSSATQSAQTQSNIPNRHRRILLAVASPTVTLALSPIIRALNAAVVQVVDGATLERALRERGPFDLVLCDAHLPGGTGLGILAGLRRTGHKTPFVIVQSIHQHLLRIVVGGGKGGVLCTRVVNELALVELSQGLLGLDASQPISERLPRIGKVGP
jgi:CheY-like chemotaxis protein